MYVYIYIYIYRYIYIHICKNHQCSSVTAVTDEHFCAKHVFDPSVICCIIDFYYKLSPD